MIHPLIRDLSVEFNKLSKEHGQPPRLTVQIVIEAHFDLIERARKDRVPEEFIIEVLEKAYEMRISLASYRTALHNARKKRQEKPASQETHAAGKQPVSCSLHDDSTSAQGQNKSLQLPNKSSESIPW